MRGGKGVVHVFFFVRRFDEGGGAKGKHFFFLSFFAFREGGGGEEGRPSIGRGLSIFEQLGLGKLTCGGRLSFALLLSGGRGGKRGGSSDRHGIDKLFS